MDISTVQERAWRNKLAKGFNVDNVPEEVILMMIEIGEAAGAWAHADVDQLGDELADVIIFAACVAKMAQVELPDVMLFTTGFPDRPKPSCEDVQRVLLMMFREGAAVGAALRFANTDDAVNRLDRVILAACRLARMHSIDLVAAISRKLDVNDAREYVRDEQSGRLVKA